jgi:NAD(P)-dependent dehydrogenase (short-subunit alcohol dehydrogenase family)
MRTWTFDDIPDQTGRTAIVTGANSGIGYETALALARKGAHVVLACRSRERGEEALGQIEAARPAGSAELMELDLASLDSVRAFATAFSAAHDRLDLLINNAGLMVPPEGTTAEGFELQFGVNVVGHFALTGLLLDRLTATTGSRVVTVSSLAHRQGQIDFANLRGEKDYKPMREYMQSKLGDLVFALELQKRLAEAGHDTISVAAHPGLTQTDLQRHSGLWSLVTKLWSNDAATGALPTLYAATAPGAEPGGYYGPRGFYEMKGHPAPAEVMPQARDRQTAERLWHEAEEATGVPYLSAPVAA